MKRTLVVLLFSLVSAEAFSAVKTITEISEIKRYVFAARSAFQRDREQFECMEWFPDSDVFLYNVEIVEVDDSGVQPAISFYSPEGFSVRDVTRVVTDASYQKILSIEYVAQVFVRVNAGTLVNPEIKDYYEDKRARTCWRLK